MANPAADNRGNTTTSINNNISSKVSITKHKNMLTDLLANTLFPEDTAKIGTLTSGVVELDIIGNGTVYGSFATPATGNLTVSLTGQVIGGRAVVIHNDGTIPTLTNVDDTSKFSYTTGQDNIIIFEKLGAEVVAMTVGGGGSGEVNTGSNLGAGIGVFKQKIAQDLQFHSMVATESWQTMTVEADVIELSGTPTAADIGVDVENITGATTITFEKSRVQDEIVQSGNINLIPDYTNAVLGSTVRVQIQGNSINFITHSFVTEVEKGSFDNSRKNVAYITYIGNDKVDMVIENYGGAIGAGTNPTSLASFDFGWQASEINTADAAQARQDGADYYLVQWNDLGSGGINLIPTANANQPLIGTRGGQQFLIVDGIDDHIQNSVISKPGSTFETVIMFVDFVHTGSTQTWINQTEAGGGKLAITAGAEISSFGKDNLAAFHQAIDNSVSAGLHMIAIVSDNDLFHKMYVDGVLSDTSSTSADTSWVSSTDLTWQSICPANNGSHIGEILHFNNALTASQIADIWVFYQNKYTGI